MNCLIFRGLTAAALAAGFCVASAALAQERSVLDRVFGNNPPTAAQDVAQGSSAELVLRIERLEQQNRELTGTVEQLQFRNRQLEVANPQPGRDPGRAVGGFGACRAAATDAAVGAGRAGAARTIAARQHPGAPLGRVRSDAEPERAGRAAAARHDGRPAAADRRA